MPGLIISSVSATELFILSYDPSSMFILRVYETIYQNHNPIAWVTKLLNIVYVKQSSCPLTNERKSAMKTHRPSIRIFEMCFESDFRKLFETYIKINSLIYIFDNIRANNDRNFIGLFFFPMK
jgi:hypothetical protein